jgi:hypothetical protein
MPTVDNTIFTPKQARQFIAERIQSISERLESAEKLADFASELMNSPAFQEATRHGPVKSWVPACVGMTAWGEGLCPRARDDGVGERLCRVKSAAAP